MAGRRGIFGPIHVQLIFVRKLKKENVEGERSSW